MIVRVKGPRLPAGESQYGWIVDGVPSCYAMFVEGTTRGTRALVEIVGEERAHTETQIECDVTAKSFRQLKTQTFWRA